MSDAYVTALGAVLVAFIGFLVNIIQNVKLARKQDNLHKDINSRLDASLKASKDLGFAEGVASMQAKLASQLASSVEKDKTVALESAHEHEGLRR